MQVGVVAAGCAWGKAMKLVRKADRRESPWHAWGLGGHAWQPGRDVGRLCWRAGATHRLMQQLVRRDGSRLGA